MAAALSFDGRDDYVEATHHPDLDVGTGNFSIDLWVKTEATAGVEILVEKRTQDTDGVTGYSLFLFNGVPGIQLADGTGSATCGTDPGTSSCTNFVANTSIADGEWHFLAVTVDRDGLLTFYIDGVIDSVFNPAIRANSLNNSAPLRLGARTLDLSGFFNGAYG